MRGIFGRAVLRQDESLGIDGESSGFEGRALAVGFCRFQRWPGMGKRGPTASGCPAPRSVIASEPGDRNDGGQRGQLCATSEARSSSPGRAADGGNRADHRDNGPPGRALTPVRSPVRKVARGFCCHRNCAIDRSGLMGDVRRAHVFVRPALPDGILGGNAMDKVEDRQVTARAAASALSLDLRARRDRIFSAGGLTRGRDALGIISRSAGQPVSRSAGQPVSRSAGQPVSRSAGQPVSPT